MKKLLVLLIACLALTVTACGSDDNDGGDDSAGGSSATTEQTETSAPSESTPPGSTTVDIKDIKFLPHDVTVKTGTTIKWTNSDQVPHTVTKTGGPGAEFDSGNVDPGAEYEQTFDTKGKIDYVCEIHPGQDGTITVK